MEVLITLVLIGLVFMLSPYIIGAFLVVVGVIGGFLALVIAGIAKMLGR